MLTILPDLTPSDGLEHVVCNLSGAQNEEAAVTARATSDEMLLKPLLKSKGVGHGTQTRAWVSLCQSVTEFPLNTHP